MGRLLLGLVLVLGLAAGPISAGERVRLALGPASLAALPVYLAMGLGRFEEAGLTLERVGTAGHGLAVRAVEAGQVDCAFDSGEALLGLPAGRPVQVVFTGVHRPIVNWVIRPDVALQRGITRTSPLAQKLLGLRGLTVGIPAPGSLPDLLARYVLLREGLRPGEEVKLASLGSGAGWGAGLRERRVEAALHEAPYPELAVARREAILLVAQSAGEDPALFQFLMGSLLVRGDAGEATGGWLRRVVRALQEATRWALANPPQAVAERLRPYLSQLEPREILEGVGAVLPALNPEGRTTPEALAATAEVVRLAGTLRRTPRFEELVRNDYVSR